MFHIYLVGLRGSGKSTVGKILAARLNVPIIDGDEVTNDILREQGYGSIGQVTKPGAYENAWDIMRQAEHEGVLWLCNTYADSDIIYTPGGGTVAHDRAALRDANVVALKAWGNGFYITPYDTKERTAQVLGRRVHMDNLQAIASGDMKNYRHPMFVKETDFESPLEAQIADMRIAFEKRDGLYRAAAETIVTGTFMPDDVADMIMRKISR